MIMMVMVMMVVMVTGAVEELSELHAIFTRFGAPCIVCPQNRRRVRNGVKKIAVTRRWRKFIRLRRHSSISRGKGRKCRGCAE
jgi:hypothetical protein